MSYGIDLLSAGGAQAAGGIINEGMGLMLAGPKRKAQMKTAKQMQDLQMKGQKEMTDFNMKKQMEMWENTGYGAQVDQMKRAGINPALLYGMGSGGGQTANVEAGNVGGQQAQAPQGVKGGEGMGLMVGQMGLLQAQKENIEADTANKKADAANKGSQTDLNKLDLQFKKDSYEDNLDIIRATFSNLQEDANRKNRENVIGDATVKQQILKATLENELIAAQTNATDQQIEQSKAQIQKWSQEIAQEWYSLDIKERELKLKTWEAEIKANFPGISQTIGKIINDAMGIADKIIGNELKPRNPAPDTKRH